MVPNESEALKQIGALVSLVTWRNKGLEGRMESIIMEFCNLLASWLRGVKILGVAKGQVMQMGIQPMVHGQMMVDSDTYTLLGPFSHQRLQLFHQCWIFKALSCRACTSRYELSTELSSGIEYLESPSFKLVMLFSLMIEREY